ncbi:MAG TPA: T9SS type A sorting domain-containing protein, partial [Spirochaetota bacterium]|nr:T9SS type A sorting domain-containing protein [Spirochaetota bacterium]
SDADSDPLNLSVKCKSTAYGSTLWTTAVISNGTVALTNLASSTSPSTVSLIWFSQSNFPGSILSDVELRIVPEDGMLGNAAETNNLFLNNADIKSGTVKLSRTYNRFADGKQVLFSFNADKTDTVTLQIYNVTGVLVHKETKSVSSGFNTLTFDPNDYPNLPSGVYAAILNGAGLKNQLIKFTLYR